MPLILQCDAPGCEVTAVTRAASLGRPKAPEGWWLQVINVRGDPIYMVACCSEHVVAAADAVAGGYGSNP